MKRKIIICSIIIVIIIITIILIGPYVKGYMSNQIMKVFQNMLSIQ